MLRLTHWRTRLAAEPVAASLARFGPWLALVAALAWTWRTPLFSLPAYGDVLEVAWGAAWYHDSLFVTHTSPLFNPYVFAPNGWYTGTLAQTPTLFLLLQPFYVLGGAAFAYNVLALLSFPVAFGGTLRLTRLYTATLPALCAALFYTFLWTRWTRASAHMNVLWLTSLLPWLVWSLERLRRAQRPAEQRRLVWVAGLVWGGMLHASLYALFLGAVAFTLWGRDLLRGRRLWQAVQTAGLALVVGSPIFLLYIDASLRAQTVPASLSQIYDLSANLNGLFVPAKGIASPLVRAWGSAVYQGYGGEGGNTNLGCLTLVLAVLGLLSRRAGPARYRLLAMSVVALVLALGPLLKWNGQAVASPLFAPLGQRLWALGHWLRPGLFPDALPPAPFDQGLPLPVFGLAAVVPFLESARVMARYAFVGALGLGVLAALGLQRLPRLAGLVLAVAWLVETLPQPTGAAPWPVQLHPAYEWLTAQPRDSAWSIIDLKWPTVVMNGGEVVLSSYQNRIPTAASVGSYWPTGTWFLYHTLRDQPRLADPALGYIFRQWGVRYVLIHQQMAEDTVTWEGLSRNPALRPLRCFEPEPGYTPWPYPICVAEVLPPPSQATNLALGEGWSRLEDWGVWGEGAASQARWVATAERDHRLRLDAFPQCAPGQGQTLHIEVNGQALADHQWTGCDSWSASLTIPSAYVKAGWNDLRLVYGYAASPFEVTGGTNGDRRALAVGFATLRIEQDE